VFWRANRWSIGEYKIAAVIMMAQVLRVLLFAFSYGLVMGEGTEILETSSETASSSESGLVVARRALEQKAASADLGAESVASGNVSAPLNVTNLIVGARKKIAELNASHVNLMHRARPGQNPKSTPVGKSAHSDHVNALMEKAESGPSHDAIIAAVNEMMAQVELPETALDAEARRSIGKQNLRHGQVSAKALLGSQGPIQDAVHDALATGVVNGVKGLLKHQADVRGSFCGFHAASAAQYLTRASIQIAMSVKACVPGKHVDLLNMHNVHGFLSNLVSPCNADIMDIIGSLVNVAGYLSLVATECAEHAEIDAVCAGITEILIGALAQTGAAGQVALNVCSSHPKPPVDDWVMPTRRLQANATRRLQEDVEIITDGSPEDDVGLYGNRAYTPRIAKWDSKLNMDREQQDLELAMCVVDATQVASALGVFGVAFDQTIKSCTAKDLVAKVPKIGTQIEEWCVSEVSYVLYSLFSAASFIASSLSHCSKAIGFRMGSECVAAVTRITASMSGLPLIASGLDLTCPASKSYLGKTTGPLKNVVLQITGLGRRLGDIEDEIKLRGASILANASSLA